MSFLLGGNTSKSQSYTQTAAVGLQVQTSVYGLTVPMVYGMTKIPGNLMWYGDFVATPHTTKSKGGGKGGSSKGGSSTSYTYSCSVMIGLCNGTIQGIGQIWKSKDLTTLAAEGFAVFTGAVGQSPWGYLTTAHPGQACPYSRIAYVAAANLSLGDSSSLSNYNFEVQGRLHGSVSGSPDCNPRDVIQDVLLDSFAGVGFPAEHLDAMDTYAAYSQASGLLISPAWTDQSTAADLITQIALLTNSAPVWSEGKLRMVPYGDEAVTGNGATYTPPTSALFDLTDDDFLYEEGQDPVILTRKRAADVYNLTRLEYYDRSSSYDPAVAEARNPALIDEYGIRYDSTQEAHMFCTAAAAQTSADLLLKRQMVLNTYQARLPIQWCILDPGDIVTFTDAALGLDHQWVRITEIDEDDKGELTVTAEEYLEGAGTRSVYANQQAASGYRPDYNASGGDTTKTLIFEPPLHLAGGKYQIWALAHGAAGSLWGFADAWASLDGDSYNVIGRLDAPARMGVVIEDTGTMLTVDISASGGQLIGVGANDAATLQTLCYVDGEYLAYETATLKASGVYELGGLVRGQYGSAQTTHAAGAVFARLDGAVFKYDIAPAYVGQMMYFKLPSLNIWGGGAQSIADVAPWQYRPSGAPLYNAPSDVSGLDIAVQGQQATLTWPALTDEPERAISYRIRFSRETTGAGWGSAQLLAEGITGTSVQVAAMNGTYMVKAVATDYAVESANAVEAVTDSVSVAAWNAVATLDEVAAGLHGANENTVVFGGTIRLDSVDTLSDWPTLAQVSALMWGVNGVHTDGYYYFGESLDLGAVYTSRLGSSVQAYGELKGNAMASWTTLASVKTLAGLDSSQWGVTIEVRTTQDDPASSSATWTPWATLVVGDYTARAIECRVHLTAESPQITPVITTLAVTVDMPDRVDEAANDATCPVGGTHVSFTPPFRATPAIGITGQGLSSGDYFTITNKSANGFDLEFFNASGTSVARTFDCIAKGYGYQA